MTSLPLGINAWTFLVGWTVEQQLAAAADAGFAGVELVVTADGPLRFNATAERCAEWARVAADQRVAVTSLATRANAARDGPSRTICEPMCTASPTGSIPGSCAASR